MKTVIDETRNTPRVTFDPNEGLLSIVGRCFPENSGKFFKKLDDWAQTWTIDKPVSIHLEMFYVNSSSAISLVEFCRSLQASYEPGFINVKWLYEEDDEESRKLGESLSSLMHQPIEMIKITQ